MKRGSENPLRFGKSVAPISVQPILVQQASTLQKRTEVGEAKLETLTKLKLRTGVEKEELAALPVSTQDTATYLFKAGRYMGVLMPAHYKPLYCVYSLLVNMLGTIYLPIGLTLIFIMLASELDIAQLLTSLQVTFDTYGGSSKLVIMAFMLPKLRSTQALTERLDRRCRNSDEIVELQKMVHFGRKAVLTFLTIFLSYSFSTFLGAIFMGHPPYSLYLPPLNWARSRWELLASAIVENIMMDFACLQQTINDAYPVIYINVLRTHIKLLQARVEKLGTDPELNPEQHLEQLKLCIKDHQNLIELHKVISSIVSITMFIQFTVTACCIGTTLVNIMVFSTEFSSRVASCFYILAVVVEIFPTCFYAQHLIDDSDRLADAIFHSHWMEQSTEYRKMVIFFLQRAQRPMQLFAGKMFPVTLNSFVSIAKFSFSLYTFIQKMNLKERLGLE